MVNDTGDWAMKRHHVILAFMRKHRVATLIVAIAAALIAAGSYVIWSANTWSAYETNSVAWQKDLKKNTDSALKMPTATSQERTKKIIALQAINAKITSSKEKVCAVNAAIAWQGFISSLKSHKEACETMTGKVGVFGTKLGDVLAYLEDEKSLTKITDDIAGDQKKKMTEDKFETQAAVWNARIEAIKKLDVHASFKVVKSSATEKAQAAKGAWQVVYEAHKSKDKSKYLEAQTMLTKAYESFSSLPKQTDKEFTKLADLLQAAHSNI